MKPKFTPGPWEVIGRSITTVNKISSVQWEIAEVNNHTGYTEANALLIAAAPEMFGLLEKLTDKEPCQYDHHGNCQNHNGGNPCPNAEWMDLKKRILEAK
jgi:hypothetical protein